MTTLMVQGTTSDAGKSALVCGLCRLLYRRGLNIAPFKPQNMALNSAVTEEEGEIGRAQALQAKACGLTPSIHMNPVLIKPNSDTGAQIIVHGKPLVNLEAAAYHGEKPQLLPKVLESWNKLNTRFDAVIVEGAGSPAEINLRENDIANMGFAEAVDCPVILIADIDRGGVFAHLVGTLELLSESEQKRVRGFVINKFRGDIALLQPGLDWLENKTGKPVLGVLPYKMDLHLEAEDGFSGLQNRQSQEVERLKIVIPVVPRISNHTDFEPLALRPDVDLCYVRGGEQIPNADLLILPGTKSVIADLNWLRDEGWGQYLSKHLRYGGKVLGICGGFQMLGKTISDPNNLEGKIRQCDGFSVLDVHTTLYEEKQLRNVKGHLCGSKSLVSGYEIHAGISTGSSLETPMLILEGKPDGAKSMDGQVMGTYLHGLFNSDEASSAILKWAGLKQTLEFNYEELREKGINDMADLCEEHLDVKAILDLIEH